MRAQPPSDGLSIHVQNFMTVPPEISSQSELLMDTTAADPVLGRRLRHRYVRPSHLQCYLLLTCEGALMTSRIDPDNDHECLVVEGGHVGVQFPAEQPDTRDWHARRELPPMPEGQSAKQSNDPVQRTEPLPVRREGSQQDLRPRNNQQQNAERPATSNGPAAAAASAAKPAAVGDWSNLLSATELLHAFDVVPMKLAE